MPISQRPGHVLFNDIGGPQQPCLAGTCRVNQPIIAAPLHLTDLNDAKNTQAQKICHCVARLVAVCRACYGVLRFIMESGAKGCEVIVSGKLRAQRAKAMKFKDGYMVSSGNPTRDYIDSAIRHVMLRQGVLGIKVYASDSIVHDVACCMPLRCAFILRHSGVSCGLPLPSLTPCPLHSLLTEDMHFLVVPLRSLIVWTACIRLL